MGSAAAGCQARASGPQGLSEERLPAQGEVDVRCCGSPSQVIELRGGDTPLRMVRCATCSTREWRVGDEPVAVDDAFALLATTYRAVPRAARAARSRAATATAARAAARAASAARPAATVDRGELAGLLQGWAVLGATG